MVKQDAMNVFLGCFQPTESSIPLWDLESDWDLHNQLLRPPPPKINQVLFHHIPMDRSMLCDAVVKQLIEGSIKKVLMDSVTHHSLSSEQSLERIRSTSLIPIDSIPIEIKKKFTQLEKTSADIGNFLAFYDVPTVDIQLLLTRYFIRKRKEVVTQTSTTSTDSNTTNRINNSNTTSLINWWNAVNSNLKGMTTRKDVSDLSEEVDTLRNTNMIGR